MDGIDKPEGLAGLVDRLAFECRDRLAGQFADIDRVRLANQDKVLSAFQRAGVSDYHFSETTGYGYGDPGREAIERVYAFAFGAEKAIVRPQLASGTHAIACCLLATLRPGDELLSVTGPLYDTLKTVIGSLESDYGIIYREIPLNEDGRVDLGALRATLGPNTRVAMIQRSRGYSLRPSISVDEIGRVVAAIKSLNPDTICFVDNCYGEFVETSEPPEVGADLVAGSLIKNPGGTLAPCGGYVVGRADLVEKTACRVTAPGLGSHVGSMMGLTRSLLQGFFISPHIVGEALKSAFLFSAAFELLGFAVHPGPDERRADIVQAIELGSPEMVKAFCEEIQAASPINATAVPEPWDMPGYDCPVIMAGGTFIQGSSIELSADAPMRPPYAIYLQGAMSFDHAVIALRRTLVGLVKRNLVPIDTVKQALRADSGAGIS